MNIRVAEEIYHSRLNIDDIFVFLGVSLIFFILVAIFMVYKRNIINRGILEIGILGLNILRHKFKYSVKACL